jgi:IS5 family transposase
LLKSGMQKSFTTQPELFVSSADLDHPILHALDDTESLLEWTEIEALLGSIYASTTGRPSYPLLTLFRGLLLGVWYRLSDVQLAQCLFRDLLFRKFCHLELGGEVPEASTLGRFRSKLVEHDLWDQLLAEINRQLEAKNIIMTQGRINIIDATPVEAAQSGPGKGRDGQPKRDPEAGWHVKNDSRGRIKSTYGFSVHTGVDEDGFIHRQSVTPGNVHDSQERDTLLLGNEAALYADSAYSSEQTRDKLKRFNIDDQVQRKGYRGKPLSQADQDRNAQIAVTRAGGERPFATYKRHYGLARTRFMGLAKNITAYGIAAMAHNIRKGAKFLTLYGLPDPNYAG